MMPALSIAYEAALKDPSAVTILSSPLFVDALAEAAGIANQASEVTRVEPGHSYCWYGRFSDGRFCGLYWGTGSATAGETRLAIVAPDIGSVITMARVIAADAGREIRVITPAVGKKEGLS